MRNRTWRELKQLSLLAVDDHSINCDFIRAALAPLVQSIQIAKNGQQAIHLCSEHAFDVVLMDLHMPDLDGISTWERIAQLPAPHGRAKVIALTAENRAEEQDRLRTAGFNGYLYKPASVELLSDTVLRVANGQNSFSSTGWQTQARKLLLDDDRAIRSNGSETRALQMRTALAEELKDRFHTLDQAMHDRQYRKAGHILHQWSGAAGYAGAGRLRQACHALERCLRNDLDSSPGTLYLDLIRRVESTIQGIELNRPLRN